MRVLLPSAHGKQLDVMSTSGRVVHNRTNISDDETLDLSQLSKGIYLLRVEVQGRIVVKKLVVE